jgi:CheY-like chemotaxis protein
VPTILVVEDNEQNLGLMRYLLKAKGVECVEARDGRQGVDRAREDQPDVVLMDLQMPVLDGYGALEALRSDPSTSDIPVLAVTAYSMAGDKERALEAGFDGYISKPIDPWTFVTTVLEFIPVEGP